MAADRSILVLGEHATTLASLAERARRLGYRAVRAKTPPDAALLSEERGFRFRVAIVDAGLPVAELGGAIDELRRACQSPDLIAVATGEGPLTEERARLRRAGVTVALWEPVGDHALRFHLNRLMARHPPDQLRVDDRVPTGWGARIWSGGRQKPASVYSASCGGVFLATRRPTQRGVEVAVEMDLPHGSLSIAGRVVYTNVPGNLQQRCLPDGMAVRFVEMPTEARDRLEAGLLDSVARFSV